MVVKNVTVNNCTPETIVIGRRGTFETMQVVFDLTYLIENYGDGTAVLALKRSQDSSAYPAVAAQDGNTLTWVVSEVDTYYVGAGECQLMWYVDEGLAKTIIYPMVVMRDILSTSEEAPDAYQEWVDNLTALGAETLQNAQDAAQSASDAESAKGDAIAAKEAAEEAAEKAEEASVHSPVIQGGYWYIWNNGQYVNTGVQAEGQKGDKGDPGEKGETGNGIASIAKTGTSGLVDTYTVTYTDGTTTTFTVTNGAKGDKGDTGETGNGIASITKTGTSGNVDTYTITYTNGQTTTFTVTNGAVSSVAGKTGAVTLDANDVAFSESGTYDDGTVGKELSNQKNAISQKAPVIINTASGDVASFADGADGMQIRKIVGTIVPVQSGTGDPSPDNVRPISGWTGANIEQRGKNLAIQLSDPTQPDLGFQSSGGGTTPVQYDTTEQAYYVANHRSFNIVFNKDGVAVLSLYIKKKGTPSSGSFAFLGSNQSGNIYNSIPGTIGNTSGTEYTRVYLARNVTRGSSIGLTVYSTVYMKDMQLEFATSATNYSPTDYEPYKSQTLPINWQTSAGTIYGGTVTLNEDGSVDLIPDKILCTYPATGWNYTSNRFQIRRDAADNTPGIQGSVTWALYSSNMLYNSTRPSSTSNMNDNGFYLGSTYLTVRADSITSKDDFESLLAVTPLQILSPIAEPVTIHLDNIGQLYTYLGTNNVWIDTGSITECDYPADTKLYIDGLTEPDEDMIANANIASGKYFVVNNQLYLSTAAIAAGASIVPGTNCTATNLAEALNAINT